MRACWCVRTCEHHMQAHTFTSCAQGTHTPWHTYIHTRTYILTMYLHTPTCLYTYIYIHLHTHIHKHSQTTTLIHKLADTFIHTCTLTTHTCTLTLMQTHTLTHTCTHTHMHSHTWHTHGTHTTRLVWSWSQIPCS